MHLSSKSIKTHLGQPMECKNRGYHLLPPWPRWPWRRWSPKSSTTPQHPRERSNKRKTYRCSLKANERNDIRLFNGEKEVQKWLDELEMELFPAASTRRSCLILTGNKHKAPTVEQGKELLHTFIKSVFRSSITRVGEENEEAYLRMREQPVVTPQESPVHRKPEEKWLRCKSTLCCSSVATRSRSPMVLGWWSHKGGR